MPDTPPTRRAQLVRAAGDILGSERWPGLLGIGRRTGYKMMAGTAPVRRATLAALRGELVRHRQRVGMLIQLIRDEEAREGDGR